MKAPAAPAGGRLPLGPGILNLSPGFCHGFPRFFPGLFPRLIPEIPGGPGALLFSPQDSLVWLFWELLKPLLKPGF